jgi:hypothetical protein
MFEGEEMPCEFFFCVMGSQKSVLDEVAEVLFQIGELP